MQEIRKSRIVNCRKALIKKELTNQAHKEATSRRHKDETVQSREGKPESFAEWKLVISWYAHTHMLKNWRGGKAQNYIIQEETKTQTV